MAMSQPSIDYIVSLLSDANKKISKQKSKSKVVPETNEIIAKLQLKIDSLEKSLSESNEFIVKLQLEKSQYYSETSKVSIPETNEDATKLQLEIDSLKKSLSESNEFIIKLQLEIDSPKKSLSESNETITKLQSEKAEILNNVMNVLKKYKPQYIHADNLSKFNDIINHGKIDKLLNFEKFDLKLLFKFNHIPKIIRMDDKIIMHIIDNCINLEESGHDNYKLIHNFIGNHVKFDTIKYLIDKNIDLIHQNKWGNTPLHLACLNSNINIIEYLIEKSNKVDIKNNNGSTPIECLKMNNLIGNNEKKSIEIKFEAKQK